MATTNATTAPPATARRSRWRMVLLVLVVLMSIAFAVAPSIVANSPLRNRVLALILEPMDGTVEAESASLGWFSPVVVYQARIVDRAGEQVLQADTITIDRPLWRLILQSSDLGQVTLKRPQLAVVVKDEYVNVVEVFGPLFAPLPEESQPPGEGDINVRGVVIEDATVTIIDHTAKIECDLSSVNVEVDTSGGPMQPASFQFGGNLDIQRPSPAGLYQPPFVLSGTGRFEPEADTLKLTQFKIRPQAGPVSITASGELAEFSTAGRLDLRGEYTYDLVDLAARLRPFVGGNLQLTGAGTRPFRLSGPIGNATLLSANEESPNGLEQMLAELTGEVDLEWDSASCFGLALGHARLEGRLANGWARLAAREIEISEGRVELATRMNILSPDPVLVVDPGRLIDRVTLTPEVCAEGLQYIAPILAEATRVQGHFSLDIHQCEIPLSETSDPSLQGTLAIHSVDVGAGPLVEEIAQMLNVKPELRLIDQSDVHFELIDDRVYHQGLTFRLGRVLIKTDGSVGLDQTVDLVATMPVPDHWLGEGPIGERLRGKSLSVPIGGTLSEPKLDLQRIPEVNADLLAGSTGNLIQKALDGQPVEAVDFLDLAAEFLKQRQEHGTPILDLLRERREQRRRQREALKPPLPLERPREVPPPPPRPSGPREF